MRTVLKVTGYVILVYIIVISTAMTLPITGGYNGSVIDLQNNIASTRASANNTITNYTAYGLEEISFTLPLRKNYVIEEMTLNFSVRGVENDHLYQAEWDFSAASDNTSRRYPSEQDFSTHKFLYAGSNGSSLFRAFIGFDKLENVVPSEIEIAQIFLQTNSVDNLNQELEGVENRTYLIIPVDSSTNESINSTWDSQPEILSNPVGTFNISDPKDEFITAELDSDAVYSWYTESEESIWFMIKDADEESLVNTSLAIFKSSENPISHSAPQLWMKYTESIEALKFGTWIGLTKIPVEDWFNITDPRKESFRFNPNYIHNILSNSPGDIDEPVDIELRCSFNQDVVIESMELRYSWRVGDTDGDGHKDEYDEFPEDPTQWLDSDGDGYGDNPDGNEPDVAPSDNTIWNPIQITDEYLEYQNDEYYFSIERPRSWKSSSFENSRSAADGISFDFSVIFREPEGYSADARLEVKAVDDFDTENTEEHVMELMTNILAYANSNKQSFSVQEGPKYFTKDDRWIGEVLVRYSNNDVMVMTKWRVTVSEYNEMYYVLTATATEDKFREYEPYFDRIFESFEIQDEDIAFEVIAICAIVIVITIILIMVVISYKKQQQQRTADTTAGTTVPPTPGRTTTWPPPAPTTTPTPSRKPATLSTSADYRTAKSIYKTGLTYCKVCGGVGTCVECEGLGTVNTGLFGQNIVKCPKCKGMGVCRTCRPVYYA